MSLLLRKFSKDLMGEIGTRSREVFELMLPAVDMFEDGSNLVIKMDMPGFAKGNIKTRLTEHYLVVSAKREVDEDSGDGVVYWEQRPLRVHKKIPLPVKVDVDEDAELVGKYENGVLTIRLPLKGVGKVRVE
jgi:HSP20 family protein